MIWVKTISDLESFLKELFRFSFDLFRKLNFQNLILTKKRIFWKISNFQISKFSKINFVTNWHKLIAPVTTIIYSHLCFNATSQKWVFSLKMKFVKWKFDNFWENFKLTRSIETNEFLFESFDWRILISRLFVGQKRADFEQKLLLEYFFVKNSHFHKLNCKFHKNRLFSCKNGIFYP